MINFKEKKQLNQKIKELEQELEVHKFYNKKLLTIIDDVVSENAKLKSKENISIHHNSIDVNSVYHNVTSSFTTPDLQQYIWEYVDKFNQFVIERHIHTMIDKITIIIDDEKYSLFEIFYSNRTFRQNTPVVVKLYNENKELFTLQLELYKKLKQFFREF